MRAIGSVSPHLLECVVLKGASGSRGESLLGKVLALEA